jgi:hypothetical protein
MLLSKGDQVADPASIFSKAECHNLLNRTLLVTKKILPLSTHRKASLWWDLPPGTKNHRRTKDSICQIEMKITIRCRKTPEVLTSSRSELRRLASTIKSPSQNYICKTSSSLSKNLRPRHKRLTRGQVRPPSNCLFKTSTFHLTKLSSHKKRTYSFRTTLLSRTS